MSGYARAADTLVHRNSNTRDYWEHPPADRYMGDENEAQHGERPYPGQANVHNGSAIFLIGSIAVLAIVGSSTGLAQLDPP